MAISPARAAAFHILVRVEREGSYAAELLHSNRMAVLAERDHRLATEIVMGVLRWRSVLDQRIAAASSQKLNRLDDEVLVALRIGAYQLQFLSRVPARAAIFESVEIIKSARKRSAASFVNAVLQGIAKSETRDVPLSMESYADARALAQRSAHPQWLVDRWVQRYGFDKARLICSYDQTVPETAIYLFESPRATGAMESGATDAELVEAGVETSPGYLLAAARRVVAGDVTQTAAYKEGRLAIQDEASQLVAVVASRDAPPLDPINRGLRADDRAILDCCAAPGMKTALLARRNPVAKVFAADLHPHRARLLQKLNALPNIHVIAADATQLPFSRRFARILADVPCSGTGTLARNPEIKWRLRREDLDELQPRQIAILKSAMGLLAPGGRLVYSTCSLEPEENENVVEASLGGSADFEIIDFNEELEELRRTGELSAGLDIRSLLDGRYLRTIPGVHPCDGFFAAMLKRK